MEAADMAGIAIDVADQAQKYDDEVQPLVQDMLVHALFMERMSSGVQRVKRGEDYKYPNYYALLLALGTPRKADLELPEWCEPMTVGECYANAWELATNNEGLTYVEGYALHLGLLTQHAWVEDDEGRIIDPTWAEQGDPPFAYYIGIKFETEFLVRRALEIGWVSQFATDWERGNEVLRLGFEMDGDIAIGMGEA